ncbi:uncharacterized protein CEXT_748751 [Caerostris extrusa]|uniref:Uncharacterized protein n=1 Tax=Caerostris extrusa TaxID=172846 RepID=A0AAV4NHA0_CAEEX|nr:uncharacterized protein CEXT_748751 [Caerostris extrusa]
MDKLRKEYMFAFDLVTTVMQTYAPNWETYSLIPRSDSESSCFTENVREAVKRTSDIQASHTASYAFDHWFKKQQINLENIKSLIQKVTVDFCMEEYNPVDFLEVCCLISELSALAYIYGVWAAPQYSIFCITHIMLYFQRCHQFTDSSWLDLDRCAQDLLLM